MALNTAMPIVTNKPIKLSVVMLNVVMLNVVMLNVVMLNVVMLNVLAPFNPDLKCDQNHISYKHELFFNKLTSAIRN
jgi:hypothetical protein